MLPQQCSTRRACMLIMYASGHGTLRYSSVSISTAALGQLLGCAIGIGGVFLYSVIDNIVGKKATAS